MSDDLPADVQSWIGEERYAEKTEFPIEMGYVYTTCSSVENGNPLFWDEKVAQELTGGPIAPPSMISAWFRPHHWAPGRTRQLQPLQVCQPLQVHKSYVRHLCVIEMQCS